MKRPREQHSGHGIDRCDHPKRALLDLTSQSGDLVCTFCSLVVQERLWPSLSPRVIQRLSEHAADGRDDVEKGRSALRNIFLDGLSQIQLDGWEIADLATRHALRSAEQLQITARALITASHNRKFLALALLCAMRESGVFRAPADVAALMGVSGRELIAAENHDVNRWTQRPAHFFELPSDRVMVICDCLGLSHKVGRAIRAAAIESEAAYQGHNPEHFLFEVIAQMLAHLNPHHPDKTKVNLISFRELLQTLSLPKLPSTRLRLPSTAIITNLHRNKLLL